MAIEKMQQALALDPLSLPLYANLADAYTFAQRYDEALATYDKVIEMDPNFRRAFEGKGMIHLAWKEYDKAIENLQRYKSLIGDDLKGNSGLGHAYAVAGHTDKALECLEKVSRREKAEPGMLFYMDYAFIYAGLKDYDKAFDYLNRAYEQRTGIACLGMIYCIRYPLLTELRADPRFKNLLEKMGLQPS